MPCIFIFIFFLFYSPKKVSVTFDTFMYLSLPLPAEKHDEISVVYVPYLPSEKPLSMSIQLQSGAEMKHLKQEIEKMNACSLNEVSFFLCMNDISFSF